MKVCAGKSWQWKCVFRHALAHVKGNNFCFLATQCGELESYGPIPQ